MTNRDWPTVSDYVSWAQGKGCTVVVGAAPGGQAMQIVSIRAPSGAQAMEVVLEMHDPLMSTTIARLDRRLGIKSYLFR